MAKKPKPWNSARRPGPGLKWSSDEDEFLAEFGPKTPPALLAGLLPWRTRDAIRRRLYVLGLKPCPR